MPERLGFDKRKALAIVEKVDLLPVDALVEKKKDLISQWPRVSLSVESRETLDFSV